MVNVNIVRTAMGIIGNLISCFLFLSPAPTFKGIVEKKDTEKFHPYPYLATLMNCALWVFYGSVHPDSFLVQLINGIGLGIEFIYIFIFFLYTKPRDRKIMGGVLVLEIVAMSVIVVCSLKFLHTSGRRSRSEVVGYICMFFNIIMYASPCSNIINVIKEKSARFITIWLCVAGFFNGICWTAYGFLKTFDKNLVIPNGIGVLCSAIMIILYLIYRNNDDKLQQTIDVKPPKNVQLADVV